MRTDDPLQVDFGPKPIFSPRKVANNGGCQRYPYVIAPWQRQISQRPVEATKVLQGSGNAALDQIATDHIRRAATFPTPPEGACTSFSFEYFGR
jgi:hypothetical protein